MAVFKAQVRDGRLVLDEPTELPEGEIVYLQEVDLVADAAGELSDEEREDLFQALDEAIESVRPPDGAEADQADESEAGESADPAESKSSEAT